MQRARHKLFRFGMELSLTYSFGGTLEQPLVTRRVCVTTDVPDADTDPEAMQEALLHRTDALLLDLCDVFDAAFAVLAEDAFKNTVALDVCAGAAFYATRNVIDICPTTAYGKMFERVQQLLRSQGVVRAACGDAVADAMLTVVMPAHKTLLRIDDCFAKLPIR